MADFEFQDHAVKWQSDPVCFLISNWSSYSSETFRLTFNCPLSALETQTSCSQKWGGRSEEVRHFLISCSDWIIHTISSLGIAWLQNNLQKLSLFAEGFLPHSRNVIRYYKTLWKNELVKLRVFLCVSCPVRWQITANSCCCCGSNPTLTSCWC